MTVDEALKRVQSEKMFWGEPAYSPTGPAAVLADEVERLRKRDADLDVLLSQAKVVIVGQREEIDFLRFRTTRG